MAIPFRGTVPIWTRDIAARHGAAGFGVAARPRVGSGIDSTIGLVSHAARGAAPERVLRVAKELADRDVPVGLRLAQAAGHSKRVGKGPRPEARRRRGYAEPGHFQRSALAFEQVASRRESRVLIPCLRRAVSINSVIDLRCPTNQVRRRRPTPKAGYSATSTHATHGAVNGIINSAANSVIRCPVIVPGHRPVADQPDQIMGVFATWA